MRSWSEGPLATWSVPFTSAPASATQLLDSRYVEIAVYIVSRRGLHSISARFTEYLGEVYRVSRRGVHVTAGTFRLQLRGDAVARQVRGCHAMLSDLPRRGARHGQGAVSGTLAAAGCIPSLHSNRHIWQLPYMATAVARARHVHELTTFLIWQVLSENYLLLAPFYDVTTMARPQLVVANITKVGPAPARGGRPGEIAFDVTITAAGGAAALVWAETS